MTPNPSMIKKLKGKYIVLSETTGRKFGTYKTLTAAKRRLAQMEFFKHLKKSPALAWKLRTPSLRKKFRASR